MSTPTEDDDLNGAARSLEVVDPNTQPLSWDAIPKTPTLFPPASPVQPDDLVDLVGTVSLKLPEAQQSLAALRAGNAEWAKDYILDALHAALGLGFVAEVKLVPDGSPAMGAYRYEISVRDARANCAITPDNLNARVVYNPPGTKID